MARFRNALLLVVVSAFLLEGALRQFVDWLPRDVSNFLATGYHTGFTGIYVPDSEADMYLMKPGFERQMYFNGYRWLHRTDAAGFRNPSDRQQVDVVLLGDSMVYGHGVNEASTIRSHLEDHTGLAVANLGRQGDCIHEEYQVLKRFGVPLRPDFVFVFFLANDVDDLAAHLTPHEVQRFLAIAADDHETPYLDPSLTRRRGWPRLLQDSYAYRALYAIVRGLPAWVRQRPAVPEKQLPRQIVKVHLGFLRKMQDLAERNDFLLVHVFIYTGWLEREPLYEALLRRFCDRQGIPFLSLRQVIADLREGGTPPFLQDDGHFTSAGTQVVAGVLAEFLDGAEQETSTP